MPRVVTATYRLQLRKEFPLDAARELVPYFHELGVSHLYLSPITVAVPGSAHGYDVVDPTRVNPELGTEDDLRALATALHGRGMGLILDIVPNHMATGPHNPYWDNVLERGRESRFAAWFDIDWDAPRAVGRLVLPVLGDDLPKVLERGEIRLHIRDSGSRIAYFDNTFPLDPATLPAELQLAQFTPEGRPAAEAWSAEPGGRERLRTLLDAQHFRLVNWRRVADINYRRFFDINSLAGIRVEDEDVFDATHATVLRWVREGILDGLRIDHIDGLREPAAYLARLRRDVDAARHPDAPDRVPIFVEKILSGDERLPSEWPVDGTTGYDFMTDVEDLFLDPRGYAALEAMYRGLRKNPGLQFAAIAKDGKRRALEGPLWADVMRVARAGHTWAGTGAPPVREIADAIVSMIVHTRVYRTYVIEPGAPGQEDRGVLTDALDAARAESTASARALDLIERAFFAPPDAGDALRRDFVLRLQQTSGPATAKGVEDTALYVYLPLASRNEVGGQPDRPLEDIHERVHRRNAERAAEWRGTMLASDTHDTKRSGDVRARLDTLTSLPAEWSRHVTRWRRLNKPRRTVVRGKMTPDTNSEYLFYQTVFGVWPGQRPERRADDIPAPDWLEDARRRLTGYMRKAAREAKTWTSWTGTDAEYEKALLGFVSAVLTPGPEAHFLPDLARLTATTARSAFGISLARLLLQCTSPGIPDFYQGSEAWNFTLVDPDNRRPVDFALRRRTLEQLSDPDAMSRALSADRPFEHATKLALSTRLLHVRREHRDLFLRGDYEPLRLTGTKPARTFAFARRHGSEAALVLARTLPGPVQNGEEFVEIAESLAGRWTSLLTGRAVELVGGAKGTRIAVAELVGERMFGELYIRSAR